MGALTEEEEALAKMLTDLGGGPWISDGVAREIFKALAALVRKKALEEAAEKIDAQIHIDGEPMFNEGFAQAAEICRALADGTR